MAGSSSGTGDGERDIGSGICEGVRGIVTVSLKREPATRARLDSALLFTFIAVADRVDVGFFLSTASAGAEAVLSSSSVVDS